MSNLVSMITSLSLVKLVVLALLLNFVIGPFLLKFCLGFFSALVRETNNIIVKILSGLVMLFVLAINIAICVIFIYMIVRVFQWIF